MQRRDLCHSLPPELLGYEAITGLAKVAAALFPRAEIRLQRRAHARVQGTLTPMPSAKVRMATALTPGDLRSIRAPNRRSCMTALIFIAFSKGRAKGIDRVSLRS
jgi:hypothetical protein